VLFHYQIICKLDVKGAVSGSAEPWSRDLVEHAESIRAAFDADVDLGIVLADKNLDRRTDTFSNADRVGELCLRIGISCREPSKEPIAPAGSYWIRPFLLRTIASLKLTDSDFESEPLPPGRGTAYAVEQLVGISCRSAGMEMVAASTITTRSAPGTQADNATPQVHLLAFYLPQFHPIPENDAWWEPGFTEWTNVTRTRPQFIGHRQPRLPADLGFYDLRLPEVRQAQADLAREYGITAFCYYYYWFDGQKLLNRPLDEVLASGTPDFPFLLFWANEPWSRGWDGRPRDILMPQQYTPGWVRGLARDVAPALRDSRYFCTQGVPVFLIYRVQHIPNRAEAFSEFRLALAELGIPKVHLAGSWPNFPGDDPLPEDPAIFGLDAYFEFHPRALTSIRSRLADVPALASGFVGKIYDYDDAVDKAIKLLDDPVVGIRHRGVTMGWDNTPRRALNGTVYHGATPANFRRWLRGVIRHETTTQGPAERLIFINAWNEWGEGTYLEPDQDFNRGWLEAVASAIPGGVQQSGGEQSHTEQFGHLPSLHTRRDGLSTRCA
jgi:lipopolysaccharide biosynthesis protein